MPDVDVTQEDSRIKDLLVQYVDHPLDKVVAKTFIKKDIYLDGRYFDHCVFRRCTIFVRLGRFGAVDCEFGECEFRYAGPAAGLMKMVVDGFLPLPGSIVGTQRPLE